MNYRIFKLVIILLFVSLLCKSQAFIQNETIQTGEDFYLYPTPSEIFEVIDTDKLSFNKNLLNPVNNEQKYVLSKEKYLNIGIYMADLAYSTFFSKKVKSKEYYGAMSNMCGCLLISADLKKNLSQEIVERVDNVDSIYRTINKHYYDIMQELNENNSNSVLYIITTGAYVESFYIVLNLIDTYSENNILLQKIAEEKYALHNLHKFSKRFEDDPNITDVIKYQEEILKIFDSFIVEEGTKRSFEITESGKIKFTGGPKIIMNKKQFEKLKETVGKIRNEIIN
jgi:hypothetical protein